MSVCGILYGAVGTGKTTLLAHAFPHWHWIVTSKSALNRAKSEGVKIPRVTIMHEYVRGEFSAGGEPKLTPIAKTLQTFFTELEKDPKGVEGVVLSEGSTLIWWLYNDIKKRGGTTGRARFDLTDYVHRFISWLVGFESRTGISVILESHGRAKTLWGGEPGAVHPREGELKYPAGPDFPEGRMIETACRPLSFVWELVGEGDPIDRLTVKTRPGTETVRKTRAIRPGASIAAEEVLTEDRTLRDLMIEAGFLAK